MQTRLKYILFIISCSISLLSCAQNEQSSTPPFSKPIKKWFLPSKLEEVSGLSWYADETLACVNDEKGKVYLYHLGQEKIIKTIEFGKNGDYEGITYRKPYFYVINSKGKLYTIHEETNEVSKTQLPFTIDNDIEGLCHFDATHLLVALKGNGGLNGDKTDYKGIYKVNLEDPNQVELAYQLPKGKKVSPSAVYYNSESNEVFILSHRSTHLFILNAETGAIKNQISIPRSVFEQPEGICISPDGRIFISNEQGDNLKANILQF